jgi:hypothetical protein
VYSGNKIEAIHLDPTKRYSEKIEIGCDNRLAPVSHAAKLDKLVDTAAGNKRRFERGLKNVLKSNPYGNQRHIWRLEFVGERGLNCGQMKQEEICARLNILSFFDLECTVSSPYSQTGDTIVSEDMQRTAEPAEVNSPSPSTELEHDTELRGRPSRETGTVRFVEDTTQTARHENPPGTYDEDADVLFNSPRCVLEQNSVYIYNASNSGIQVKSLALGLDISPPERHMDTRHSDRRDMCKPTGHTDSCPCANDLHEHCCANQNTRHQAHRNVRLVLEGFKNLAFVLAPVIGLIYPQGAWPLLL